MWRTTDKSCATNRYERPSLSPSALQQIQDTGADGYIQRRSKFIQHQQLRIQRQGPGDTDALWRWPPKIPEGIGWRAQGERPTIFNSSPMRFIALLCRRYAGASPSARQGCRRPASKWIDRGHRILKDHADLAAYLEPIPGSHPGRVPAEHFDASGVRARPDLRISMIVVVLPQPDSPTTPSVSPSRTSRSIPSTA